MLCEGNLFRCYPALWMMSVSGPHTVLKNQWILKRIFKLIDGMRLCWWNLVLGVVPSRGQKRGQPNASSRLSLGPHLLRFLMLEEHAMGESHLIYVHFEQSSPVLVVKWQRTQQVPSMPSGVRVTERKHEGMQSRRANAGHYSGGFRSLQPHDHRRGNGLLALLAWGLSYQGCQWQWHKSEKRGGAHSLWTLAPVLYGR